VAVQEPVGPIVVTELVGVTTQPRMCVQERLIALKATSAQDLATISEQKMWGRKSLTTSISEKS